MKCLKCGAELGSGLGLCPRCRSWRDGYIAAKKEALPWLSSDDEKPAGFWLRVLAYCLDEMLIAGGLILCSSFVVYIGTVVLPVFNLSGVVSLFMFMALVSVLMNVLYFASFESSLHHATPGKLLVGIKVVGYERTRVSFSQACIRNLYKIISGVGLCFGFLLAAFTPRKQGLHDLMASTLVVKRDNYRLATVLALWVMLASFWFCGALFRAGNGLDPRARRALLNASHPVIERLLKT